MPLEAGRCEVALPEITLDMYVTAATMEPGGVLSQVRRVRENKASGTSAGYAAHRAQMGLLSRPINDCK